jgi:hypothetical protein
MKRRVETRVVGHGFVRRRTPELEAALRRAFKGANFNNVGKWKERYDIESAILSSLRSDHLNNPDRRSIIAMDDEGRIVGAVFHVTTKPNRQGNGTYGWFFTSPELELSDRAELANQMINQAHDIMRQGGAEGVVVSMGTKEGERFLRKRHGYRKASSKRNVWEKSLTE